jgi:two-component system, NtrC family, sensor kinase
MQVAVIASAARGSAWVHPLPGAQPPMKRTRLVLAMVGAVGAVIAVAAWDERREAKAALDDFAREQTAVARSGTAVLVGRVDAAGCSERTSQCLVDALRAIHESVEQPGTVVALVRPPSETTLVDTRAREVSAPAVQAALDAGRSWVGLTREEAAALGLPRRTALAGIAQGTDSASRTWSVVVVATAQRVRDRESRAMWRLLLGTALASLLVGTFGGLALREQRRELELQRTVAVAEAVHARDRRLVEADKLATLGALATGIAHEVSTPLGVIVGRAEQLLPRMEPQSRSHSAVAAILEQAARISRIVRGFLTLARGGTASLSHVEPGALARSAVELVEHRFAQAGVALIMHRPEPNLPLVACDPALFEQVLVNLLLNACDACAPGGRVELGIEHREDRVAFLVDDDGVGISPEAVERCLEPLFTTKAPGQGTGLGLTIASEIVKHHHGTLSFQPRSDAGLGAKGTRVRVEIATVARERRDATG